MTRTSSKEQLQPAISGNPACVYTGSKTAFDDPPHVKLLFQLVYYTYAVGHHFDSPRSGPNYCV